MIYIKLLLQQIVDVDFDVELASRKFDKIAFLSYHYTGTKGKEPKSRGGIPMSLSPVLSFQWQFFEALVAGDFITRPQLAEVRKNAQINGADPFETMIASGVLFQATLATVLTCLLRIPAADLRLIHVDPRAARLIPEEYARKNVVMPLCFDTRRHLLVATRMPRNLQLSIELASMAKRRIMLVFPFGDLEGLINRVYYHLDPTP